MKKLLWPVFLFAAQLIYAQTPNVSGAINASGASSCSVVGSCVILQLPQNSSTATVVISGTFSGTLQFEQSADGLRTFTSATATPQPPASTVTSTTSTGTWVVPVSGMSHLQVRGSAYSSGVANVIISASTAASTGNILPTVTAANSSVGATGSAPPASATYLAALSDTTGFLTGLEVDANDNLLANATNLPTVVDTNGGAASASTIRVITATNSPVQLAAGSNVAAKFGIDQTTPGTTNAVQATNFPATVDANNGVTSANTPRVTISSDSTGQVKLAAGANTIGSLAANQSINQAQISGTATSVNNGTTDAGTARVTISSDSTGQVKLASGANTIGALTANQSVNTAQVGGSAYTIGQAVAASSAPVVLPSLQLPNVGQAVMASSVPVAIANNQSAVPISAASLPLPSNAAQETGGNLATLAGGVSASVYQQNVKQWAGNTLGSTSNYGTSPGAVAVPGVNAFVTNTITLAANQSVNEAQIGGSAYSLGQAVAASSAPVVLPSTQLPNLSTDSSGALLVSGQSTKTTYSAAFIFSPGAASDIFGLCGSGTKTARLTYIQFNGTSTAASAVNWSLQLRSTADTGGGLTALTAVKNDSNNAAATASPVEFTSAPSLGTGVAGFRAGTMTLTTSAGAIPSILYTLQFGIENDQEMVLRGTGQCIYFNQGSNPAGESIAGSFQWTEE